MSSLIRDAEEKRAITETRVCRRARPVSHLLFADDCFLFFRAEEDEAHIMKNILLTYEKASGQSISLPKSEIFYSRNVIDTRKNAITNILGVRAVLGTGKYLGFPSMIGRDRTAMFAYIKDRVWQKINSWSSKCLSKAGRGILIKSVLQAIPSPSYVMSIFQLPATLITAIERMMNSFWWGHGRSSNRGINWLSWEKLSMHKTQGGLGFKDLSVFNLAMLGKQGWKFMSEPDSLVSRIFKARYFPNKSYLTATIGHNPSYVWRSILWARFIVRGGARWSIGSGNNIPIRNEPWMCNGDSIDGNIAGAHFVSHTSINSLVDPNAKRWNEPVVRQVFSDNIAAQILNTPLFEQVQQDRLIWKAKKHGHYSVRSAYRLCVNELIDVSHLRRPGNWSGIWRLKVPPKVKNLVWCMCRGVLPTRVRLHDKGVHCPTDYVNCNSGQEDFAHLFFTFPFAIQVWTRAGLWTDIDFSVATIHTAEEAIFSLLQNLSTVQAKQLVMLLWSLWKCRNLKVWEDVTESCAAVIERAKVMLDDWEFANSLRTDMQPTTQPAPHGLQQEAAAVNSSAVVLAASATAKPQQIKWQPPASGRLKCNVDAAFSIPHNRTGVGNCLRDDERTFVLAKTVNFEGVYSVEVCNPSSDQSVGTHSRRWA